MNPLEKIFRTSSTHFFSTIYSIKTNKIETVAKTIFPWIALTTLIGLTTLHSKISVGNHSNPKIYILGSSILALSLYLITLDSHTETKAQAPKTTPNAHEATQRGTRKETTGTDSVSKRIKELVIFQNKLNLISTLGKRDINGNLVKVIKIINEILPLNGDREELHQTLFNCKLSIALPAFKAYFERENFVVPNEVNELTKHFRFTNFICYDLKMSIEDFQSNGTLHSDSNLFLPSLLLIHFFFEKNCYFDTNRICKDRTADMTGTENEMSDEEVKNLLTNLAYDTSELNRCIKEVYEAEKNKDPCPYRDVWASKQESFNNWIDDVAPKKIGKSAKNT